MRTADDRSVWWAVLRGLPFLVVALAVVGGVVAAPTLLADSLAGRLVGVCAGTALLVGLALAVKRLPRRTFESREMHLGREVFSASSADRPEAPQRSPEETAKAVQDFMQRMQKEQRRLQRWKLRYVAGLLIGGALGALTGSALATVGLVAAGLVCAMGLDLVRGLSMMRRMSDPRRMFGNGR